VPEVFANPGRVVEGWYWLLRSDELRRGRARAVSLMGRDLVVFRGANGTVAALDAYCPHMGAHLAEGRVEGNELRCLFHHWRYDAEGRCTEVPSLGCQAFPVRARSWPVAEKYGLVWLWTGDIPRRPLPEVPELAGRPITSRLGNRFAKNCHPHVVLINAIDEHHFNSVHHLPVRLSMASRELDPTAIEFSNVTGVEGTSLVRRVIARFYRGPLTYSMTYFHGSTGTVTLGPDGLHFYVMFALRPTPDGKTEGQTILVTRERRGLFGRISGRVLLALTRLVAAYFARGDTKVFRSIRFTLGAPIPPDHAILDFVRHTERQPTAAWGLAARPEGARPGSGWPEGSRRDGEGVEEDGSRGPRPDRAAAVTARRG
jgi:phenylpropionate dioxygenase-like ring-hydroxylating dioxygenase large terminal subunit